MKLILKAITCILLSWVLGCALLVFVFKIPVQEMKNNAQRSTAIYDYEGVYPQLISGYKFSQLDNSTDATMILGAIFPGTGDSLKDAMLVHHIGYVDRNPVGSLTDFANDVKAETYTAVYPRYWHGYLVILKILLLCFDIADIRMISLCCFWGMIFYIVLQLQKQGKGNYIIPFLVTLLVLNPLAVPLSLQFSTVSYIALTSVLLVLKKKAWQKQEKLFLCLLIGILTAYFDFLTFPLVGLYFPIIFLLMGEVSWKEACKFVILGSIMWIVGYGGMWAGKWLIGSLATNSNFFADAFLRASSYSNLYVENEKISILHIVFKNIFVLVKWPMVIGGVGIVIWLGKRIYKKGRNDKMEWKWIIPFGIIILAPFCWYVVAGTHSYIHYWFTYRELCVSIFAILALGAKWLEKVPNRFYIEKKENKEKFKINLEEG